MMVDRDMELKSACNAVLSSAQNSTMMNKYSSWLIFCLNKRGFSGEKEQEWS